MTAVRIALFEALLLVANVVIAHLPSRRTRLAFYRTIMKFAIGTDSYIFMGTTFDSRGNVRIGQNCVINERCRIDNRGLVTIGDFVSISADTIILTADHDVQSTHFVGRERPVTIGDYVFIGTRATILPGVSIGRGAVVGAGSIVTRDVAPYAIVAGNPAKIIGKRNESLAYHIDYGRWLH